MLRRTWIGLLLLLLASGAVSCSPPYPLLAQAAASGGNPVLFVTQVPIPADFTTIGATFGNHIPAMWAVGRGGDLWIHYPDGTLKNLTEAAGYGVTGFQDENAIAVREPNVHWDGQKALFSMVIGAPEEIYQWETYYWQIYEISGLGQSDTPVITKITNQPLYNNVAPIYDSDDNIIFASDRPRDGQDHLCPQLDEYEEAPTVSGLWKLDPSNGDLTLLDHSPSGDFSPMIDSFGRVIFTRWDHLQRDQQADSDNYAEMNGEDCTYCTFNWESEHPGAEPLFGNRQEQFPEPRADHDLIGTNLWGHTFNHFLPWMMNQDGTELEIVNHVGRHELFSYMPPSFTDDPNLQEFYDPSGMFNQNRIENFFHVREDPSNPGQYFGTNAPEFYTHSAGQIISLNGAPGDHGDEMAITYVTHPDTADFDDDPSGDHSGLYRNPTPLSDGSIIVVHTPETDFDENIGSRTNPQSRYDFRLKQLTFNGSYWVAGAALTPGISKSISYYDPDYLVNFSGDLWELDPVEVVARTRPNATAEGNLEAPEQAIFDELGIDVAVFRAWLKTNQIALVVSRDVTTRDDNDTLQPFNLAVAGGVQTIGASGTIYSVAYIQFFQGDLLRSLDYGNDQDPRPGRRVLAQALHAPNLYNLASSGPIGSQPLALDGSMAAFVPGARALSWQTTDNQGAGVVRERYWLTFQPGEIRLCGSCHGLNAFDQAGSSSPQNEPEALRILLQYWQSFQGLQPEVYLPTVP